MIWQELCGHREITVLRLRHGRKESAAREDEAGLSPNDRGAKAKDCSCGESWEGILQRVRASGVWGESVKPVPSTSSIIYTSAGAPPMIGNLEGGCRTCGLACVGSAFDDWVKPTFTDWDKLMDGSIICHACQFCFTDQNEELARRLGKDAPQRMRNYSHFVVNGEWWPLSKGAKPRMLELLMASPEVAIVAESGQKHIIFRSRPGWWQIEERSCRPFSADLARALFPIQDLYAGFSKAEIESGRYSQHRIFSFGIGKWHHLEESVRQLRGSPILSLALFLVQKDEVEVDNDDSGNSGPAPVANLARNAGGIQDQVRQKHMATVRGQHKKRCLHVESGSLF